MTDIASAQPRAMDACSLALLVPAAADTNDEASDVTTSGGDLEPVDNADINQSFRDEPIMQTIL